MDGFWVLEVVLCGEFTVFFVAGEGCAEEEEGEEVFGFAFVTQGAAPQATAGADHRDRHHQGLERGRVVRVRGGDRNCQWQSGAVGQGMDLRPGLATVYRACHGLPGWDRSWIPLFGLVMTTV